MNKVRGTRKRVLLDHSGDPVGRALALGRLLRAVIRTQRSWVLNGYSRETLGQVTEVLRSDIRSVLPETLSYDNIVNNHKKLKKYEENNVRPGRNTVQVS